MTSTHDEQALAAAYVLGALDAPERQAFESHLRTCSSCLAEVRSLQRVADALSLSVPQRTPRPEVRARVLSKVTGRAVAAERTVTKRMGASVWLPLAAGIVLVAGLAGYARLLQGRVSNLEARLDVAERRANAAELTTLEARRAAEGAQTLLAVLAAPDLLRVDLAGLKPSPTASARALWSRNRGMVFTVSGLPLAPAGRVYQVWVVTGPAPVSAGLLTLDQSGAATTFFQTPPDIAAPVAVAVTLEPAGGVPAPTGEMYLIGKPSRSL
jgi:anti-sigma-K factor RskA